VIRQIGLSDQIIFFGPMPNKMVLIISYFYQIRFSI